MCKSLPYCLHLLYRSTFILLYEWEFWNVESTGTFIQDKTSKVAQNNMHVKCNRSYSSIYLWYIYIYVDIYLLSHVKIVQVFIITHQCSFCAMRLSMPETWTLALSFEGDIFHTLHDGKRHAHRFHDLDLIERSQRCWKGESDKGVFLSRVSACPVNMTLTSLHGLSGVGKVKVTRLYFPVLSGLVPLGSQFEWTEHGQDQTSNAFLDFRARLHDNVPDRPSAKVASVGVPANWRPWHLKLKVPLPPKGVLHGRSCHPVWAVSASGLSRTRLADFLPPWRSVGWDFVMQPGPGVYLRIDWLIIGF